MEREQSVRNDCDFGRTRQNVRDCPSVEHAKSKRKPVTEENTSKFTLQRARQDLRSVLKRIHPSRSNSRPSSPLHVRIHDVQMRGQPTKQTLACQDLRRPGNRSVFRIANCMEPSSVAGMPEDMMDVWQQESLTERAARGSARPSRSHDPVPFFFFDTTTWNCTSKCPWMPRKNL
jgi:hypothetical protein